MLGALAGIAAAALGGVVALEAHDLFLRPRDFIVRQGSPIAVRVLNGTFTSSESIVAAERLRDLSVVGPEGMTHPDRSRWVSTGMESGWTVDLGGPGTYVLAAALAPKTIRLTGAQFASYLREEGLVDVLAARRTAGEADAPAHERYAKHVKALVSVRARGRAGSTASVSDTAYRTVLGYPAELVPIENPYRLSAGATLQVRALVNGAPAERQIVLAGGRTASGKTIPERQTRTGSDGVARVTLTDRGTWYVKFIRMTRVPAASGDSVDYESRWATLTFAVP